MKIVGAILLVVGLFIGFVAPHFWGHFVSGAGVQLPQFIWSRPPPRTFHFSVVTLLRVIGIFLMVLSILSLILFRGTDGR